MGCGQIFGGNFFDVRKEMVGAEKFFPQGRWKFFEAPQGAPARGRWKFLTCPQGRVLTRIFWVSAREGFEVVVEVVVDVVEVVVDVHVGDVDK